LFSFLFYVFLLLNISNLALNKKMKITKKQEVQKGKYNVIGVVEVIRHGARTTLIPGQTSDFYYGTFYSQLTINGFRQEILLGRWIRRRYIKGEIQHLFNENFEDNKDQELEIISSPRQRSIFSTSAHTLGMFPRSIIKLNLEGRAEVKTDDIPPIFKFDLDIKDGKEIVIDVVHPLKDNLFSARDCKIQNHTSKLIDEARNNTHELLFNITYNEKKEAIDDILNHYDEIIGERAELEDNKDKYTNENMKIIFSIIRPLKYHMISKLKLKNTTLDTMKKTILNKKYYYRLDDSKEKKLFVSKILNKIKVYFTNKINNKTNKKMIILSGFDNNIIDIIVNLFNTDAIRGKINEALHDEKIYNFHVDNKIKLYASY